MTPLERRVNMAAVFLPFAVTAVADPAASGASWLGWSDVAVFALMYLLSGFGVTVGFHRMLTHRAFQTHKATRYLFAYLGHALACRGRSSTGSPTTASTTRTPTSRAIRTRRTSATATAVPWARCKGLWHAHAGWLWRTHGQARAHKYAKDLVEDRGMRILNRKFPLIVARLAADPGRSSAACSP